MWRRPGWPDKLKGERHGANPEQWQKIKQIVGDAIEREPPLRGASLTKHAAKTCYAAKRSRRSWTPIDDSDGLFDIDSGGDSAQLSPKPSGLTG